MKYNSKSHPCNSFIFKQRFFTIVCNVNTAAALRIHTHDMHYMPETKLPQFHPFTVATKPRKVKITRIFQNSIELNWLPPTEPNGEVHYVIYYTPKGGTEQSIDDTGSDLTHYNLTGLERNRVYTNIAVQAVNILGRSNRSVVIAPPGELSYRIITQKTCKQCTVLYKYIQLCKYMYTHHTPDEGELCTVLLFPCVYQFHSM